MDAKERRQHRFRLRGRVAGVELVVVLEPGIIPVGRAPSNRLVLPWAGVSREHALLQVEADHVVVVDHPSKNGTFVKGHPVGRAELEVGDVVAFGLVELQLEALAPEDAELALTLSPVTHNWPLASRSRKITPEIHRSRRDQVERWLVFIRHFVSDLTAGPGGCGLALTRLAGELGTTGACLLSIDQQGREESVLAAGGEMDAAALRGWLAELTLWDPGGMALFGEGLLISQAQATGYFVPAAGGLLALVVNGTFGGRDKTEPLLQTLLSLIRKLVPLPDLADLASLRPERAKLCFPPAYIRGVSPVMEQVYGQLEPLVEGDLPVLIRGETGVGKEMVAEILHLSSPRRQGPFVAINCAAVPAELLEAELFGIGERVATGVAGRRGQFQLAQGGTLFLDEVGEMSTELQVKLLRVLQEKKLRPLGNPPVDINVRLLTATNADLEALIEQGTFRRDLYFRIAGFVVRLPTLAERRDDLPLLIAGLFEKTVQELGKPVRGLTVGALERLIHRPWPGNVRELAHEIRRLVCLCPPGGVVDSSMISGAEPGAAASRAAKEESRVEARGTSPLPVLDLAELERLAIAEALERTNGNQVRAARLLGVSRHVLRRRLGDMNG